MREVFFEDAIDYIAKNHHDIFIKMVDHISKTFLDKYSEEDVINAVEFFKIFGLSTDGKRIFVKK